MHMPTAAAPVAAIGAPRTRQAPRDPLDAFSAKTREDFERAYTREVEQYRALPAEEQAMARNPVKAKNDLKLGYAMCLRMYFARNRSKRPPQEPQS
jgi:hypothetical protein